MWTQLKNAESKNNLLKVRRSKNEETRIPDLLFMWLLNIPPSPHPNGSDGSRILSYSLNLSLYTWDPSDGCGKIVSKNNE